MIGLGSDKNTLNPEITLLFINFMLNALLKVPKICNIKFWFGNDTPPPLALFRKFIRFGGATSPKVLIVTCEVLTIMKRNMTKMTMLMLGLLFVFMLVLILTFYVMTTMKRPNMKRNMTKMLMLMLGLVFVLVFMLVLMVLFVTCEDADVDVGFGVCVCVDGDVCHL